MMSVFFKMGEGGGCITADYFKVRQNLFKRWHPKVCKNKEFNISLGKDSGLICHSGHCFASQGP